MKNIRKIQTIIGCQVTKDLKAKILKIDQSAFIQNFFKSENIIYCNILIKTRYFIEILKYNGYEKAEIKSYQRLIKKLMYLLYRIKPYIFFAVAQFIKLKHNLDLKTGYMRAAKKVICYLKGIIHLGFVYRA